MNIQIRKGEKRDVPQLLKLIKELAHYEKAPEEVIVDLATLENDGFGSQPFYHLFVAEDLAIEHEEKIIAIALYYYGYSTWKGKKLYLDDLVVTENYRRNGIGKMLFDRLIQEAFRSGANQMRWHVLDWNEPAINFYKKYDADLDPTWVTGKLTREQLAELTTAQNQANEC